MNCKICGKPLTKGSRVCKYCGAENSTGNGTRRRSKKARRRQRIVTLIMLVLVLILLAAVIFGIVKMIQKLKSDEAHIPAPTTVVSDEDKNNEQEEENQTAEPEQGESIDESAEQTTDSQQPVEPDEPDKTTPEGQTETPSDTTESQQPEQGAAAGQADSETGIATDPSLGGDTNPGVDYVTSTKTYTVSLNKTSTTATLNHYRELRYSFDQTLESGVKVVSETWVSSDESIVHIEVVGDVCRAWGKKVGEATVTLTIVMNNGQTIIRNIPVSVSETKGSANTGSTGALGDENYILKDSATHLYTTAELSSLSDNELMLARNEIYARHGYIFKSESIQAYFESKSWYHGTDTVDIFDFSQLNSTERANVSTIKKVEKSR